MCNKLINCVSKWKYFRDKKSYVKDFYTRVVAFCIETTTLKEIEEILFSLLLVSNSEVVPNNSVCKREKDFLITKIKTFDRDPLEEIEDFTRVFELNFES